MIFTNVAGPPFVYEDGFRRDATIGDFERFVKLAHVYPEIDSQGGLPCEPADLPFDSRHLDMQVAAITLSDKPHMGALFEGWKARDGLALAAIAFGGRDELERGPATYGIANVNSPLTYDAAMVDVLFAYAEANQAIVVTPFLLMGAMSPVTIPAALVQQTVEALAGVVLVQLIRPGAPVVMGSFLSHTDMQSGSPGFGGPESGLGLLCSGQIARRLGLPWRAGGGGLTSSPRPDAQAAYEALVTHQAAFLSGANLMLHAAGWLESGLVASLREVRHRHRAPARPAHRVHAVRDRRGQPRVRRPRRGRPRRPLPRRGPHPHALPRLLLPPDPRDDVELRALDARRRARDDRAGRRALAHSARVLRAAADRRGHPRGAPRVRRAQAARAGGLRERAPLVMKGSGVRIPASALLPDRTESLICRLFAGTRLHRATTSDDDPKTSYSQYWHTPGTRIPAARMTSQADRSEPGAESRRRRLASRVLIGVGPGEYFDARLRAKPMGTSRCVDHVDGGHLRGAPSR